MIKSLFRLVAFLLLAAGFVAAIMDGARTLANSTLEYVPLGASAQRLFGQRLNQLQPAIEGNIHPLLWDPVLVTVLMLPTSLVLLTLGFVCYRIGRRSGSAIGHLTRK